ASSSTRMSMPSIVSCRVGEATAERSASKAHSESAARSVSFMGPCLLPTSGSCRCHARPPHPRQVADRLLDDAASVLQEKCAERRGDRRQSLVVQMDDIPVPDERPTDDIEDCELDGRQIEPDRMCDDAAYAHSG